MHNVFSDTIYNEHVFIISLYFCICRESDFVELCLILPYLLYLLNSTNVTTNKFAYLTFCVLFLDVNPTILDFI